ncbi:hypothetical protein PVK06_027810 [Gossypium arboreum]|uniref:Uncharacterized protein n=1 Tax=Gossypium arboreum TaxID=29729 RepID=A0ABR0P443_GOSAR|nr:hypothetical protein PVK06_027810 [Gossypium arboreum]
MCICVKCGCFSCKHETPAKADDENQETGFLDVMLAIFLPPVAIYKKEKGCTLCQEASMPPSSYHLEVKDIVKLDMVLFRVTTHFNPQQTNYVVLRSIGSTTALLVLIVTWKRNGW